MVAQIILLGFFRVSVPEIAIGFYINITFGTIYRKIKRIIIFSGNDKLLPFCWNVMPLEFCPQFIFQRTFIKQVIYLAGVCKFFPGCWNENNSAISSAVNWFR